MLSIWRPILSAIPFYVHGGLCFAYRRRTEILLAILFVLSAPVTASSQQQLSVHEIASEFVELTTTFTKNDHSSASATTVSLPLAKWDRPVTWAVIGAEGSLRGTRPLDKPIKNGISAKLLGIFGATLGGFSASPGAATILAPSGFVPEEEDWAIDNVSQANITFEVGQRGNGSPKVTVHFETATFTALISTDLIVLYGPRARLQQLKRQVPSEGVEAFDMSRSVGSGVCDAYLWPTRNQGMGSALLLVDDQQAWVAKERCLYEAIGRAVGIRGRASRHIASLFSSDSEPPPLAWSSLDRTVIKSLYDPQVKSGMTSDELRAIAAKIVEKHMPKYNRP